VISSVLVEVAAAPVTTSPPAGHHPAPQTVVISTTTAGAPSRRTGWPEKGWPIGFRRGPTRSASDDDNSRTTTSPLARVIPE